MRIFFVTKWVCAAAFLTIAIFHAHGATVTAGLTIYSPGLENGLVGHWTFDGKNVITNVADSSGGGNSGNLILGATGNIATTTKTGPIGQALLFDGVSDYVLVGDKANLEFTSSDATFTISAWIKPDSTTGDRALFSKYNSNNNTIEYAFFIDSTNNELNFWSSENGTSLNDKVWKTSTANGVITPGMWQQVVVTVDLSTDEIKFYINGSVSATTNDQLTGIVDISDLAEPVRVGAMTCAAGTPCNFFSGIMDNLRVYDRVLSASEVKRLYTMGAAMRFGTPAVVKTGLGSGLVAHWTFDGKNMISNVADSSGNAKNGALLLGATGNTATTTAPGVLGQALVFDGVNDYAVVASPGLPTGDFTISAWARINSFASAPTILMISDGSNGNEIWFGFSSSTGAPGHNVNNGAAAYGSTAPALGTWAHAVLRRSGDSVEVFLDGVSGGTAVRSGTLNFSTCSLYLGVDIDNGCSGVLGNYMNGSVDDIRFYNRALSNEEIKHLYRTGAGTKITPSAPPVAENTAPTPSDAGRVPSDGFNIGGGDQSYTLYMDPWTDPEGDSIEYYFESYGAAGMCLGTSIDSGWISDPTASGGFTISVSGGYGTTWRVKARDEHGLESGYNTCYWFDNTFGGSCPYVFGWDGEEYQFEVDIFGSGGLGYKKWGLDDFVQPTPNRTYVLKNTKPKNGVFEWRIVGDLAEVDYFDYFRLYSVFIPEDRDIIVESPTLGSGAKAKSILHTVSTEPLLPKRAVRLDTNEDVTEDVSVRDDEKVIINKDKNETYEYEMIEVDFGDVSQYPTKKLIIGGSTTYPVTEEGIARKQQFGLEWGLYVQDANGEWKKVPNNLFSPTKPLSFDSVIAVDISKVFISKNTKIRLEYLYKVYVDYIALDVTEDMPLTVAEEHPITDADLHDFNGWHKFDKDGHVHDYYDVVPLRDDYMDFPGYYTRFGKVDELLADKDDKFVIMAKGDEVTVKNSVPKLPVPDGYKRVYMLDVSGYYKALGKTETEMAVEPMPFSGMSAFPYPETESYPDTPEYQAYLSEWNTRYLSPDQPRGGNGVLEVLEMLLKDL